MKKEAEVADNLGQPFRGKGAATLPLRWNDTAHVDYPSMDR